MTQQTFNLKNITAICLASIMIATVPVGCFAVGQQGNGNGSTSDNKISAFCKNIEANSTNILNKMLNGSEKITNDWSLRDQKMTDNWNSVDSKVANDRKAADSNRDASYLKLEQKATTEVQKAAVKAYEESIDAAVNARRASYDAARTAFRNGVKEAISGRRSQISDQVNKFRDSVQIAVNNAKASCHADSSDGEAIRTTYRASMRLAKDTFKNERSADDTVGSKVQQLITVRNESFKAADKLFSDAQSAAKEALKTAFGEQSGKI